MHVHDGLTSVSTDVNPYVVSAWLITCVKPGFGAMEKGHNARDFLFRQVEERLDVSPGDNERVADRHRIGVLDHEGLVVRVDDSSRRDCAKRAVIF